MSPNGSSVRPEQSTVWQQRQPRGSRCPEQRWAERHEMGREASPSAPHRVSEGAWGTEVLRWGVEVRTAPSCAVAASRGNWGWRCSLSAPPRPAPPVLASAPASQLRRFGNPGLQLCLRHRPGPPLRGPCAPSHDPGGCTPQHGAGDSGADARGGRGFAVKERARWAGQWVAPPAAAPPTSRTHLRDPPALRSPGARDPDAPAGRRCARPLAPSFLTRRRLLTSDPRLRLVELRRGRAEGVDWQQHAPGGTHRPGSEVGTLALHAAELPLATRHCSCLPAARGLAPLATQLLVTFGHQSFLGASTYLKAFRLSAKVPTTAVDSSGAAFPVQWWNLLCPEPEKCDLPSMSTDIADPWIFSLLWN